jgi:hypothetical protein
VNFLLPNVFSILKIEVKSNDGIPFLIRVPNYPPVLPGYLSILERGTVNMPITKHRLTIESLNSAEPNQSMDAHALATVFLNT